MVLLTPDDSLLCSSIAKKFFIKANATFFIQDKCCHLMMCLHLMEPSFASWSMFVRLITFGKESFGSCRVRNKISGLVITTLQFAPNIRPCRFISYKKRLTRRPKAAQRSISYGKMSRVASPQGTYSWENYWELDETAQHSAGHMTSWWWGKHSTTILPYLPILEIGAKKSWCQSVPSCLTKANDLSSGETSLF